MNWRTGAVLLAGIVILVVIFAMIVAANVAARALTRTAAEFSNTMVFSALETEGGRQRTLAAFDSDKDPARAKSIVLQAIEAPEVVTAMVAAVCPRCGGRSGSGTRLTERDLAQIEARVLWKLFSDPDVQVKLRDLLGSRLTEQVGNEDYEGIRRDFTRSVRPPAREDEKQDDPPNRDDNERGE